MAVGPADLAQVEGEDAVVLGYLVALDQVRYRGVTVWREPQQIATPELVEHMEAERVAGNRSHPGTTIVADPLNATIDDRLGADALGDRGQLALGDEFSEQRRLPFRVPVGGRTLIVVDLNLDARPVVGGDRVVAQLGGRLQLIFTVLHRRGGQVWSYDPATEPQQGTESDARDQ